MPNDEATSYRLVWCPAETHGDREGAFCSAIVLSTVCIITQSVVLGEQGVDSRTNGLQIRLVAVRSLTKSAWLVCAQNTSDTLGLTAFHSTTGSNTFLCRSKRARGRFVRARGRYISHTHVGLPSRSTQNHVAQHFFFFCRCTSYSFPEASFAVQRL